MHDQNINETLRMEKYRELSKRFSLIRTKGKEPIEKGWSRCCLEKRTFEEIGFQPGENAGIACGPASGIIAADIDDEELFRSVSNEKGWELPDTFTVRSSRGRHYYYAYPNDGKHYGNRSTKSKGFDIRGVGGYIMAPSSIHPETGEPYVIEKDIPIAPAPEWLIKEALQKETVREPGVPSQAIDLATLGLSPRIEKFILEGKPKGERSEAIMSALVGLVAAGASNEQIFKIFEHYPIGEKYMETGPSRHEWLQKQIDKARDYVKNNHRSNRPEISSKEVLEAMGDNERGEASLFVKYFKERFCYDHWEREWYKWSGHWEKDTVNESLAALDWLVDAYANEATRQHQIYRKAQEEENNHDAGKAQTLEKSLLDAKRRVQNVQRRRNILVFASSGKDSLGIDGSKWDADPYLFPCRNGVVDLRNGDFRKASPLDYIKTVAPIEWHGMHEAAPTWNRFLNDVFQCDSEMIGFIQRLLGYSISGLAREHILPIFWGQGRNGKSVLIETIRFVLGPLAEPIPVETLLDQGAVRSGSSHTADLLILKGRRLVWANELSENKRFDPERVKWLVGGDRIVARAPYGKGFMSFDPTHTLFVLTNNKPPAPADDYAFWQRIHLVHFGVSFVDHPSKPNEKKRDPNILNALKAESSGILSWLIQGFLQWQEQGLNPPRKVYEKTLEYQEEEDIIGHFLTECCYTADDQKIRANDLYQAYDDWCKNNGHRAFSNTRFGKKMANKFEKRTSNGTWYIGINIKDEQSKIEPSDLLPQSDPTSNDTPIPSFGDIVDNLDGFRIQ